MPGEVLGKCTETLKQGRQLSLTNIPTLCERLKSTAGEDYPYKIHPCLGSAGVILVLRTNYN